MSTRGLIRVYNEFNEVIVTIYNHYDSYPSGLGNDLANFLKGRKIVNGIGTDADRKSANGMDDLAAQLVATLKNEHWLGGVYLCPVGRVDYGQEFEYQVRQVNQELSLSISSVNCSGLKINRKELFEGIPEQFFTWLDELNAQEE